MLTMMTSCATVPEQPAMPTEQVVESGTPARSVNEPPDIAQAADPWAHLLARYTTDDGGFRYQALLDTPEDRALLAAEVTRIGEASLDGLSRDARLSFLINAYNALTLASVLELWPVASVLSEDGFFDGRTHLVAGQQMTLNELENDHIRPMGEPRIHFAVNCASAGCPPLARVPWTAAQLESMLQSQTRAFVRGTTEIDALSRTVRVSQIFEWFATDFDTAGGVRAFISAYLDDDDAAMIAAESTTLSFVPYDWALNGR